MKQFDQDGLNELFDLEIEPPEDDLNPHPADEVIDDEEYLDRELKQLGETANQILASAQTMIHSTPNPETVAAASSLISSIGQLLSEFNKSVLIDKRFKQTRSLQFRSSDGYPLI